MSAARVDGDPVKLYERIVGQPPSAEQADRMRSLGSALRIKDNDALWSILVALEYHQRLYADVPAQVATQRAAAQSEANRIAHETMVKAARDVETWTARAKSELTSAVEQRVSIGREDRKSLYRQTVVYAACVVLVCTLAGFFVGFRSGRAESLLEAQQIAGWVGTSEGQVAKAMSDSGELDALVRCNRPGWETVTVKDGRRICVPNPEKKRASPSGWFLP